MRRTKNSVFVAAIAFCALAAAFLVNARNAGGMVEFVDDSTPIPDVGAEGGPAFPLSASERAMWLRGRRVFDRDFHSEDGLGAPDFNGDSCRACHQDPVIGGGGGLDVNVSRAASDNGGMGPYADLPGGQILQRLRRPDTAGREECPPAADVFELRQAPSLLGLGLVELVPESEILQNADPLDLDQDGIRGYARYVGVGGGVTELGRFGWKAGVPSLLDFVNDAATAELGLTVQNNLRGFGSTEDTDGVPDPELSAGDAEDLTFFLENLAAPPRGGAGSTALVMHGENVFFQLRCDRCHTPTLMSTVGPIQPYSNFLLHNVSSTGYRGMEEPDAPVGFYRTPPLWGISRTAPYMHDGAAETLSDAIMAHAGEATFSRGAFVALSGPDREAFFAFLSDL
jgi:CxxC motif-containing protein (DUF1111 family)